MYNSARNHLPPKGSESKSKDEPLPIILAGPIVRRCEYNPSTKSTKVNIWIATSKKYKNVFSEIFYTDRMGNAICPVISFESSYEYQHVSDHFWVWTVQVSFHTDVFEYENEIAGNSLQYVMKKVMEDGKEKVKARIYPVQSNESSESLNNSGFNSNPEFPFEVINFSATGSSNNFEIEPSNTLDLAEEDIWLKVSSLALPPSGASLAMFAYDINFELEQEDQETDISVSPQSQNIERLSNVLEDMSEVAMSTLELPLFSVQIEKESLRCLYGSCRKAHGIGQDASIGMEKKFVAALNDDDSSIPNALFLTGDQIYADDVNLQLLYAIKKLSSKLMKDEKLPLPWGDLYASSYTLHTREDIIVRMRASEFYKHYKGARAAYVGSSQFTSTDSANHLISFSEISSMYLLMWNDKLWDYVGDNILKKELKDAYEGTKSIRRILANTPTYMIIDDHDVTDDFYFDDEWKRKVLQSKSGSRLIANSLSSYWLFQDWGNKFDFDHRLSEMLHGYTMGDEARRRDYDIVFNNYHEWSFVAPTNPPAIFLNTRTRRVSDKEAKDEGRSIKDAAILINKAEYLHLESLFNTHIGEVTDKPIIVVSPSPILTLTSVETGLKIKADMGVGWFKQGISKQGRLDHDIETFNSNTHTIHEFMMRILDIQPSHLIIVSGDVHYGTIGYGCLNQYKSGKQDICISQLTSSALKNEAPGIITPQALKFTDEQWGYRHNTTYLYERQQETIKIRVIRPYDITNWNWYSDPEKSDFILKYDFVSTGNFVYSHNRSVITNNFGYIEKPASSTKILASILDVENKECVTFEGDTKEWPI